MGSESDFKSPEDFFLSCSPSTGRTSRSTSRHPSHSKYCDAYRELYNDNVLDASTGLESDSHERYKVNQIGASMWSGREQAIFLAALERSGRIDIATIASAITTKSIPEVRDFLLLLESVTQDHRKTRPTLWDVPAAVEISNECEHHLEEAGDALAWYQDAFERKQEEKNYGIYWLITPMLASKIEHVGTVENSVEADATMNLDVRDGTPEALSPANLPISTRSKSCTSCQFAKSKCDRGSPCGSCIRRKNPFCLYKSKRCEASPAVTTDRSKQSTTPVDPEMIDVISEAKLLKPQMMLRLSKEIFMNRCPTLPSPWPHWAEYATETIQEPAMFRSALIDFHTLTMSITRRLVQTAIIQATSRLRSQRYRVDKPALPLVRRRDVLTALHILGMPKDCREYWRGVPRRCSLRVYDGISDKLRSEISWDRAEEILASKGTAKTTMSSADPNMNDSDTSSKFAAAKEDIEISMDDGSTDELELEIDESDAYSVPAEEDRDRNTILGNSLRGARSNSLSSGTKKDLEIQSQALDQFDKVFSHKEEEKLWRMLELEMPVRDVVINMSEDKDIEEELDSFKTNDWQSWTKYRADWEELPNPISPANFGPYPESRITWRSEQSTSLEDIAISESKSRRLSSSRSRKSRQGANIKLQADSALQPLLDKRAHPTSIDSDLEDGFKLGISAEPSETDD